VTTFEYPAVELRTSPHIKSEITTPIIMRNVVYALLPLVIYAFVLFGLSALSLIIVTTAVCVITEYVFCLLSNRPSTLSDWSAVITGILLGLVLPPGFPLWMAAVGAFFSIAIGKVLFGGLGYNVFNPALVGRAFLQAAFPTSITSWTPAFFAGRFTSFIPSTLALPFGKPPSLTQFIQERAVDGFSGATPLALFKFQGITTDSFKLFTGMISGSAGETCALLILLCGAYLVVRNMLDWRITAGVLLSVFLLSGIFYVLNPQRYPSPFFMLFSGGLMLGAVFMATDMVTSPTTPLGVWIFGVAIGVITVVIRLKGGLPEGVMYAILIANAFVPLIENLTQPRVYGTVKRKETVKT